MGTLNQTCKQNAWAAFRGLPRLILCFVFPYTTSTRSPGSPGKRALAFVVVQFYTEDYNLSSQHLCEKLGMRREGMFLEFISFVNNPDGTPRYENTVQYAILKKEWDRRQRSD